MRKSYELRNFSKSSDSDFTEALIIYANNVEPVLRTDTREIIYWLDNYCKLYKDKFLVFGFYCDDKIIGFAQLVYFEDERIVFVDYIVIDKNSRKQNTFYEFVEQIREFLLDTQIIYDYIIAEVGGFTENLEPTNTTRSIIRLLKLVGFGVLKTNYFHPMLGKNLNGHQLQSILMVYTDNEVKSFTKESYLRILKTIYLNHYKRWYEAFFSTEELNAYTQNLEKLFIHTEELLKNKIIIEVNGYHNSYATGLIIPKEKSYKKIAKYIAILLLFVTFIIGFGFLHYFAKTKFSIDTSAQTYIIIASSIGVLFVIALFTEGRTNSLTKIVEKLINKITG